MSIFCDYLHTIHVLQPLDVGLFSSFKSYVGLALNALVGSSDGRVPTSGDTYPKDHCGGWPKSLTPLNLMSEFRKTGIHPLNPGCIHDRVADPSKATEQPEALEVCLSTSSPISSSHVSSGHVDTAGSFNSLETNAESMTSESKSPVSSLSDAMDALLIQPKLTRKLQRKQNHITVRLFALQTMISLRN